MSGAGSNPPPIPKKPATIPLDSKGGPSNAPPNPPKPATIPPDPQGAPSNPPPPIVVAITNTFAQQPPPAPIKPCEVPIFEAHIVGVQFLSPIRVARRDTTITGEHWTEGVNVVEPFVVN